MKSSGNLDNVRLWLAFPFAYAIYLVTFIGITSIMPLISHGGCSGNGSVNPEFYIIFTPRFIAAFLFVFSISYIITKRKLFYSGIACFLIISSYLGPYLFPILPYLSDFMFPVGLWERHETRICLLIAKDLSSLGSVAALAIVYWMQRRTHSSIEKNAL